jgi:hypothetical protein
MHNQHSQPMGSAEEQNKQLVRQYFEAYDQQDIRYDKASNTRNII